MSAFAKYGSNALAEFLDAPDVAYGTGDDGSVVFDGSSTVLGLTPSSSIYSMTRDLYCYDLELASNVSLQPNGYRIFVKNILTLNDGSVIGWPTATGWSTVGTLAQGGALQTQVTNSLGGDGAGGTYTATPPSAALGGPKYYEQPHQAIKGYSITASGGPTYLTGGGGGSVAPGLGGGVIVLAARYIACAATSTNAVIRAEGGASNAGGGVILVVSTEPALPSNVSTSVVGNGNGSNGTYKFMQLV